MSYSFQIRFCFLKADDEAFSGVRQARHLAMHNMRVQCTALGLVISNSETQVKAPRFAQRTFHAHRIFILAKIMRQKHDIDMLILRFET